MVWNGPFTLGGSSTSISNGGTTLAIDSSGNITVTPAAGASVTLTAGPGQSLAMDGLGNLTLTGSSSTVEIDSTGQVTVSVSTGATGFKILTAGGTAALACNTDGSVQITGPLSGYFLISTAGTSYFGSGVIQAPASGTELGFFGTTPTSQPPAGTSTSGYTPGTGSAVAVDATFAGPTGGSAWTIDSLVGALKALGLIES
jgi:hypothetical protein